MTDLHDIEREYREADALESCSAWLMGAALQKGHEWFAADSATKREAAGRYNDWASESLGCERTTAHRYRTFARNVPESDASLGATMGYHVGRCVEDGIMPLEDALELARSLPTASEFIAAVWDKEPRPPKPRKCPKCGYEGAADEFKEDK